MTPSILIIEDDLTFATMLKTWLGKKGFEVDTAGSSSRAKKQLSARSYDLILSDLRLPDQDGIHLLAWLRNQSCTTPFIIMTSYAEIQTAVQAIKQGASNYIAKPVQPDELLKKIKEAIQNLKFLLRLVKRILKKILRKVFWKVKVKQLTNYSVMSVWLPLLKCLFS